MLPQSLRLVGQLRIMGGYVWRPCRLPHARCCHACSTASQCARAGKSDRHQHMRLATRCVPVWRCGFSPAHPRSRSRGSRCAARSRAPVPAPVRPRWGLPLKSKAKDQTQALARFARHNAARRRTSACVCASNAGACRHAVQGIHPPCTACMSVYSRGPSRVRCAALRAPLTESAATKEKTSRLLKCVS